MAYVEILSKVKKIWYSCSSGGKCREKKLQEPFFWPSKKLKSDIVNFTKNILLLFMMLIFCTDDLRGLPVEDY